MDKRLVLFQSTCLCIIILWILISTTNILYQVFEKMHDAKLLEVGILELLCK
jgi:LytS/YehU family sensor histidine kinase